MRGIPEYPQTDGSSSPYRIIPSRVDLAAQIYAVTRLAHGVPLDHDCDSCIPPEVLREQLERFPAGQLVAVTGAAGHEKVVGVATLMRTNRPPTAPPLGWRQMIGSPGLANHEPHGRWLYGVELSVHPEYRRRGIGSALYRVRKALVRRLGLAGLYAGGMLKGFWRYRGRLTPREYAQQVIRGDIEDPTVTMQFHRGFRPLGIIENYENDPEAGNCAVLIVWTPEYRRRLRHGSRATAEARRR